MKYRNDVKARALTAISIILALTVTACSDDNKTPEKTHSEKIIGIWEQTGYGTVFAVTDQSTTIYDFTRATCLKTGETPGRFGFSKEEIDKDIIFSNNSSEALYQPAGTAFATRFHRLNTIPDVCETNLVKDTPQDIFDHFWHTFNDYYAFNVERNIDWASQYALVSSKITPEMTDDDLFSALSEVLSLVNDGHVGLISENDEFYPAKLKGAEKLIADSFEQQSEFDDISDYAESIGAQYHTILKSYLDEGSLKSNAEMSWAIINQEVGFVEISSMIDYVQGDDADAEDEVAAVKVILDQIMSDLENTKALIIDVRFNGGGYDEVGLAIANRFTDQRRQAMSKTARGYYGETKPVTADIYPEGNAPYLKPVIIIAGPDTGSAAEVFLIAMNNLPNVTIMGENSSGDLSDILGKQLPNGWEFGLSNEVYLDHLGKSHEVIGFPPEIKVQVFSLDELENKRNLAIEAALSTLGYKVMA